MEQISGPRVRLTRVEKQLRQQTVYEEFALRSSLETQAEMRKIPRFGRWMSFAALLAMAAAPLMLFKLAVTLRTIAAVPILRPIAGNVYVISQDSKPSLERSARGKRSPRGDGIAVDSRARSRSHVLGRDAHGTLRLRRAAVDEQTRVDHSRCTAAQ